MVYTLSLCRANIAIRIRVLFTYTHFSMGGALALRDPIHGFIYVNPLS